MIKFIDVYDILSVLFWVVTSCVFVNRYHWQNIMCGLTGDILQHQSVMFRKFASSVSGKRLTNHIISFSRITLVNGERNQRHERFRHFDLKKDPEVTSETMIIITTSTYSEEVMARVIMLCETKMFSGHVLNG